MGGRYTNRAFLEAFPAPPAPMRLDDPAHRPDPAAPAARAVFWVAGLGPVVDTAGPGPSAEAVAAAVRAGAGGPVRAAGYDAEGVALAGLHMTAAKLLFAGGALGPLPGVVEAVEAGRRGVDMHGTKARNEHAYYCDVVQLLAAAGPPLEGPAGPGDATLYALGDSHCLSPAWRALRWAGRRTLLVPLLATGVKCWHLRPGARAFPGFNWARAVDALPRGAAALFVCGEIDCREGLRAAVDKGRHPDLAAAIAAAVDHYVAAVAAAARRRRLRWALVHPAPPVRAENRDTVRQFNRALAAAVRACPPLVFLDLEAELLAPDGGGLRAGLELDGTHLGPACVAVLEAALNRHAPGDPPRPADWLPP